MCSLDSRAEVLRCARLVHKAGVYHGSIVRETEAFDDPWEKYYRKVKSRFPGVGTNDPLDSPEARARVTLELTENVRVSAENNKKVWIVNFINARKHDGLRCPMADPPSNNARDQRRTGCKELEDLEKLLKQAQQGYEKRKADKRLQLEQRKQEESIKEEVRTIASIASIEEKAEERRREARERREDARRRLIERRRQTIRKLDAKGLLLPEAPTVITNLKVQPPKRRMSG